MAQKIFITQVDAEKLRKLLWDAGSTDYRGSEYLKKLRQELERAEVVDPKLTPPDVITMNSTAVLEDIDASEEMVYTLVFPEDADIYQGKISILAPIGTGMLGYRVGDIFEWDTPAGRVKIRVKALTYQPEAAGKYD